MAIGIRGQLTLLVATLVAASLTVALYAQGRRQAEEELADFEAGHERLLDAVAVAVAMEVAGGDSARLDAVVTRVHESLLGRDLLTLAVLGPDGRVLADTTPGEVGTVASDDFSKRALAATAPFWFEEESTLRVAFPAVSEARVATVVARYSLARLRAEQRSSRLWLALGGGAFFVALSVMLFVGLDRLVVRPVRALLHATRRMGEGYLSTRAPTLGGAEMGELATSVNKMAEALQHERENLEHLVAERTRELSEANARLERLAVTDGLTGLNNHRRFQEALAAELLRCQRHKRPLGLLMVDVDFFKRVNDAMGHPAGDDLLRRLACVLSEDLRQTDLIARYGGEEFTVILPETTRSEALQVGERMREAVEAQLNDGTPWPTPVTISVGVATFPDDGDTPEVLLAAADEAMYVAKRQGRNRVVAARTQRS